MHLFGRLYVIFLLLQLTLLWLSFFSLEMTVLFGKDIPFEVSFLMNSIVCRLFFFLCCQFSQCIFAYSYKVAAWGVNQRVISFFLIFDGFFQHSQLLFRYQNCFENLLDFLRWYFWNFQHSPQLNLESRKLLLMYQH